MSTTALLRFNPETQAIEVWMGDHWQELPEARGKGEFTVFALPIDVTTTR